MNELLLTIAMMCQVNGSTRSEAHDILHAQQTCQRKWWSCARKILGKVDIPQILADCSTEVLLERKKK